MFAEGQEILEKRYKVIKRLGGGAFGEIYRGNFISIHTLCHYIFKSINQIVNYSWEEEDRGAFGSQSGT